MGFEGGGGVMPKKYGFKGGQAKNLWCKGGVIKKFLQLLQTFCIITDAVTTRKPKTSVTDLQKQI